MTDSLPIPLSNNQIVEVLKLDSDFPKKSELSFEIFANNKFQERFNLHPSLDDFQNLKSPQNSRLYLEFVYRINSLKDFYSEIRELASFAYKPSPRNPEICRETDGLKDPYKTRKKRTSFQWIEANNEILKPRKNVNFERIKSLAFYYAKDKEKAKIVCRRQRLGQPEEFLFLPNKNMFQPRYISDQLKKFSNLPPAIGFSLSLKYNNDQSLKFSDDKIDDCFETLIKKLNKKFEKKIVFLRSKEIGKRGLGNMLHLHIAAFNLFKEFDNSLESAKKLQRIIKKIWHKITGDSFEVRVSIRGQKASSYLLKYYQKELKGEFTKTIISLWALGSRVFTTSTNFLEDIAEIEDLLEAWVESQGTGWEFLGILFDCEITGHFDMAVVESLDKLLSEMIT